MWLPNTLNQAAMTVGTIYPKIINPLCATSHNVGTVIVNKYFIFIGPAIVSNLATKLLVMSKVKQITLFHAKNTCNE